MNQYKSYQCGSNDAGRRLDRILKKLMSGVPAGLIYSSLRKGRIRVNGRKKPQSYTVQENDIIEIDSGISAEPGGQITENRSARDGQARSLLDRLTVLKTDDLLFVNKPRGMLVHGGKSLASLVIEAAPEKPGSLSFTPAPLHRLDRNTSGLTVIGISIAGSTAFSRMLRERTIEKHYIGLCSGGPYSEIRLEDDITRTAKKSRVSGPGESRHSGAAAVTTAVPLLISESGLVLVRFSIETGRTHQIRVQCSSAGFPLAGDSKYGGRMPEFRFYILHAWALVFREQSETLPAGRLVTAGLPRESSRILEKVFGSDRLLSALEQLKKDILS